MAPPRLPIPSVDELIKLASEAGYTSLAQLARAIGVEPTTLRKRLDIDDPERKVKRALKPLALRKPGSGDFADVVHKALKKRKLADRPTVAEIADDLDVAPKHVREALEALRGRGFRIPPETEEGSIALQRVIPDKGDDRLHPSLLEGDELTVGLVSDTHLSSNEEALAELNLAYDLFEKRGITRVWNPGDLTCGRGIFRTQDSEIKNHTFETQVDYLEEHYPGRDGIVTEAIGGNHDLEGEFGRIGADPVEALSQRREDIRNLGAYSAWIELPGGAYAHLLHGSGGMSYSYSYKAQKLVDGYAAGQKPALLAVGHWHVSAYFIQRNVHVFFPGCFEWKSPFLARKGLSPAVGFWILNLTIGDDGSVVKLVPEWHQFFEGRTVKA
jgi:predicted phosphodiesterase